MTLYPIQILVQVKYLFRVFPILWRVPKGHNDYPVSNFGQEKEVNRVR